MSKSNTAVLPLSRVLKRKRSLKVSHDNEGIHQKAQKYEIDGSKKRLNSAICSKLKHSLAHNKSKKQKWSCSLCTFYNTHNVDICKICGAPRRLSSNVVAEEKANAAKDCDGDQVSLDFTLPDFEAESGVSPHTAELDMFEENEPKNTNEKDDEKVARKMAAEWEENERKARKDAEAKDACIAQDFETKELEEMRAAQSKMDDDETMALEIQAKEDVESAVFIAKKERDDALRMRVDESLALKIQNELNKGMAWFCKHCFVLNENIQSFQCKACSAQRPKPEIPKYILLMRDEVSSRVMSLIRECDGAIINIGFTQHFIVKYFEMCERIGTDLAHPKIVYHWTRMGNFAPITHNGLKVPDGVDVRHATDEGYYGRGIYTSPDPVYAQGYGHGAQKLFVCLSLPGRQYPSRYPRDMGISLKDGYDSHISDDDRKGNEWVFFDTDQLLLCYLVSLKDLAEKAKVQMEFVCQFLESKYMDIVQEESKKINADDL